MIHLIQRPCPSGTTSGGYRYQEEVSQCLEAAGRGRLVETNPAHLASTIAEIESGTILIDGLLLADADLVGELTQLPIFILVHSWSPSLLEAINRLALAGIVLTGDGAKDQTPNLPHVICRPGISLAFRRQQWTNQSSGFLCAGRYEPGKGYSRLLSGFAERDLEIRIDGCGPGWDQAEQDHTLVGLRSLGTLTPEQLALKMASASWFVSPSPAETFGMAVAEATTVGTPVLAVRTGEIAKLIEHHTRTESCVLFENVEDLVEAVTQDRLPPASKPDVERVSPPARRWEEVAAELIQFTSQQQRSCHA